MKVNGLVTKLKAEERMSMLTVLNISVTGKMIGSMVMESKHGLITLDTRVTTSMARSIILVHLSGKMAHRILENFITTIFTVKVFIRGQTKESTKETGKQTKCTAKELSLGQTVENMSASILMIKRRATENSFGPMADVTGASGKRVNSTAKDLT